jgi:hypothetical protein
MLRINHPPSASLVRVVRDFIYMLCARLTFSIYQKSHVNVYNNHITPLLLQAHIGIISLNVESKCELCCSADISPLVIALKHNTRVLSHGSCAHNIMYMCAHSHTYGALANYINLCENSIIIHVAADLIARECI